MPYIGLPGAHGVNLETCDVWRLNNPHNKRRKLRSSLPGKLSRIVIKSFAFISTNPVLLGGIFVKIKHHMTKRGVSLNIDG